MSVFGGWILLRPLWFLALPLLVLLGIMLYRQAKRQDAWSQVFDPVMMLAMTRMGRHHGARAAHFRDGLAAMLVLILALTGPSVMRTDSDTFRNLDGVVFVLDMSPSVTQGETFDEMITTTRFLVNKVGTRQVALVVFAGDAYVASPLTHDWRGVDSTLSLLDAETMPDDGSRINRGLKLGLEMLQDAEIRFGDIILLADADGLVLVDPELVRELGEAGVQLSVLQVAGRETLGGERIAALGGGVATTLEAPSRLVAPLETGLIARLADANYAVMIWKDYGRYLLLLALPFMLIGLMRARA